jgi:membrane protease YdiL (CAAX protease family)
MTNGSAPPVVADTQTAQPERPGYEKRLRWFELFLVLLVTVAGPLLNSLVILNRGSSAVPRPTDLSWWVAILREITGLLLLGYVLFRRGRQFKDIGLRWSFRDVGVGLILFVVSFMSRGWGAMAIGSLQRTLHIALGASHTAREIFGHPSYVSIPFSLLNPFFEELIVRAYLMTEIVDLTGSAALAVVVSTVIQSSYHLYYGWATALTFLFPFLIYSLYYARSRRVTSIIVAHELFDAVALAHLW